VAFHPTQPYAYSINEAGSSLISMKYDAQTGKLSDPETLSALAPNVPAMGSTGAHVVVHPGGKFVYAGIRSGANSALAIFAINATTGRAENPTWETGGGMIRTPRDFGVDPTGSYLISANQDAPASVIVFRINQADGKLTKLGDPVAIPGPACVVFLAL
jgi:6-phosphogluconolactonase